MTILPPIIPPTKNVNAKLIVEVSPELQETIEPVKEQVIEIEAANAEAVNAGATEIGVIKVDEAEVDDVQ